jgi:endonuclease V-like protein UPF0215 family
MRKRPSKEVILEAARVRLQGGNYVDVARRNGLNAQAILYYFKKYPSLEDLIEDLEEKVEKAEDENGVIDKRSPVCRQTTVCYHTNCATAPYCPVVVDPYKKNKENNYV